MARKKKKKKRRTGAEASKRGAGRMLKDFRGQTIESRKKKKPKHKKRPDEGW